MGKKIVSGFTFIKHGLTLGYPIKESILSIEPLCDEIIINVGYDDPSLEQDDGTYQFLKDHFPGVKYKFIKSLWDPKLTQQGLILSEQTNIALNACSGEICQYIQGDEAIHEKDLQNIENAYKKMYDNSNIEGLVFDFTHFYGSSDIIRQTRMNYRREVRTIRNHKRIVSHLDAQGFKTANGEKLRCILANATVLHYGWARSTQIMRNKIKAMDKLYHGKDFEKEELFDYFKIWGLKKFKESHPQVMKEWLDANKHDIDIMSLPLKLSLKDLRLIISDTIETVTGHRIGEYKNFNLL